MPINLDGSEVERIPLVHQRLHILDLARGPRRLHLVVIHDHRKIGQLMLTGAHRRFPDRALINLSVAGADEYTAVALLHSSGERHSDTDRQTVTERACRGLDAWNLTCFWVTPENGIAMTEAVERLKWNESFVGEHDIECEAAMSFAEYHTVAVEPVRLFRPIPQDIVIQHT